MLRECSDGSMQGSSGSWTSHPETHGISACPNRLPRTWRTACVLIEAACELARARLYTLRGPSHCFRSLGKLEGVERPGDAVDERLAIETGRIVAAAARRMPFRALCLQQAIAVRRMLTRRGVPVVVYLGVSAKGTPRMAHAWVAAGDSIISGDTDLEQYVVVGRFV